MRKFKVVILAIIASMVLAIPQAFAQTPEETAKQNARLAEKNGNMSQFGHVTANDKYEFYVANNADYTKDHLYRYDPKTKENKKIFTTKKMWNIEAVGDWIYYLGDAGLDYRDENHGVAFSLYKVKTDGTKNARVTNIQLLTTHMLIDDGWIYFEYFGKKGLYKMKLDGTGLTKIAEGVNDLYTANVNKWGDTIVYDSHRTMYYVSEQTKDWQKIDFQGSDFIAYNNIVYINHYGRGFGKLSLEDGSYEKEFIDIPKDEYGWAPLVTAFHIKNGYIYYGLRHTNKIVRVKTDGTAREDFLALPKGSAAYEIYFLGNVMYYNVKYDEPNKSEIYRLSMEKGAKPVKMYSIAHHG
ncbi:DUF5050 domain-containing protein [Paenibacillus sp. MSJ-34]|uniref:DUF5050 domain-containing protein n=1 Tax=Paenibacillus sp. MSJ-34 TaxID=2841529 RepID=UPI001C0F4AED|nr:DUF5050 domain-containing protein [Paenibacillus sp. MSJ-34]MBU5444390.1 DUF5050 domain-containing protein [Paenibacillus sp. MSJ-34]